MVLKKGIDCPFTEHYIIIRYDSLPDSDNVRKITGIHVFSGTLSCANVKSYVDLESSTIVAVCSAHTTIEKHELFCIFHNFKLQYRCWKWLQDGGPAVSWNPIVNILFLSQFVINSTITTFFRWLILRSRRRTCQ